MPRTCSRLALLAVLPLAACGSKWGAELRKATPQGEATIYHSAAVDAATATNVFEKMIDVQYHFASNLPEQIDRVDGRLTLRLGNDNEDTIAAVIADPEGSGVLSYMRGLAYQVSQAVGGEPVDIVLCRRSLDEPFHTVAWKPE